MFLKQKIDYKIKRRTVVGGNKHRDYISKEYPSSPTVTIEYVLISCTIYAREERNFTVLDIPDAFIQTKLIVKKIWRSSIYAGFWWTCYYISLHIYMDHT